MRMTVLGSGGWIPTSSRQTSCYLITSGTEALILDAGTGFGALHINPSLLDGVETVTVALSHFHLDHVTGLGFVSARAMGGRELTIAGPGSMAYGRPTRSIVEGQLLASPVQTTSPLTVYVTAGVVPDSCGTASTQRSSPVNSLRTGFVVVAVCAANEATERQVSVTPLSKDV